MWWAPCGEVWGKHTQRVLCVLPLGSLDENTSNSASGRKCAGHPCILKVVCSGVSQGTQHSKNNPSQSKGCSHQAEAKAVTQDAGYMAGYSSSSAATFRKQNPYFSFPFLLPVQDTLQSYLLVNSPAMLYICSAETQRNSIYFFPYLLSTPLLTCSVLEKQKGLFRKMLIQLSLPVRDPCVVISKPLG